VFDQPHALLVARQRIVEAELAVLQVADQVLQGREGLLKRPVVGRFAHPSPFSPGSPSWLAVSTRLMMRPLGTRVTIQSPGCTCPTLRTTLRSSIRLVKL